MKIEEKEQASLFFFFFFLNLELLPSSKAYIPNRCIIKATYTVREIMEKESLFLGIGWCSLLQAVAYCKLSDAVPKGPNTPW